MPQRRCQRGFTLIELSIVLVIIGLLAGGILVGQDLIHAATLKAQVAQINSYNMALNTFRIKYNGLPGDLKASEAAAFGFVARDGDRGHGDGNGILEPCNPPPAIELPVGCEFVMFWSDLSAANLIAMEPTPAVDGDYVADSFEETTAYYPRLTLVNDATFIASTNEETSGLWLVAIRINSHNGGATSLMTRLIFPADAFDIDTKMDDGLPISGGVQAKTVGWATPGGFFFSPPLPRNDTQCVTASDIYNIPVAELMSKCQLNFKMSY
jgi:prepilin-type N-terminal cleavage/methylation domain-containing protein